MTDQTSPFDEWYAISEELVPFIGERAYSLFAHAVFDQCGAEAATAYFREQLAVAGTDVDQPQVTETERLLIDWGRQVARDANALDADWRRRFDSAFNPRLRVSLIRFAALCIATAVVDAASRPVPDEPHGSERRA
ncbi:MAG TPA: hypothetical protein VGM94_17330 [Galbitalea sp.]